MARRAQVIWPKIVEVVKYWKTLPKSKQPGQGKPEKNKSYQTLLKNYTDPMVLPRLAFFEEVSRKLNKFLRRFQTDAPMVPFLVDTIEEVLRDFCSKFTLDDVMKKAEKTLDLVKLDMMNVNIHKLSTDLGFSLRHDVMVLKKSGKVNDTQIFNFKAFLPALCSHIVKKTPVQSHFARCARAFNPIHMAECPDSCRKLFNYILQKLVNTQHISFEFADESKVQYAAFLQNIVKADKTNFQYYSIDDNKLDEFFIGYVEDHARYNKFAEIMKIVLTLSHGQASVEREFSVSKKLLVENLQESSLIAQRRLATWMPTVMSPTIFQ